MYVNPKKSVMKKNRRTNAEQSAETIRQLIRVATPLFAQKGFSGVSAEEIVREAQVTRGALYHHFEGKKGLFVAVVQKLQEGVSAEIEKNAMAQSNSWEGFLSGCRTWLRATADPQFRQIVIVDAPAVLGWDTWLEIDGQSGAGVLKSGIQGMIDEGTIAVESAEALAQLLNGALNQAALWISRSEDQQKALTEATLVFESLLTSLRQ